MGELISIVYKPMEGQPPADGYLRVPRQEAHLSVDSGIAGDAKGVIPSRHRNIMASESLAALAAEGFQTAPGQMGEQLILAGVEIDSLPVGARLQIGTQACVEIKEPRTGCAKFERNQSKLRQEAAGRLGMMAQVVTDGPIAVGDPVTVLEKA